MEEFIKIYGNEVLEELFDILNNKDNKYNFDQCDDDLCDDESCMLYKSFKIYIKYR